MTCLEKLKGPWRIFCSRCQTIDHGPFALLPFTLIAMRRPQPTLAESDTVLQNSNATSQDLPPFFLTRIPSSGTKKWHL